MWASFNEIGWVEIAAQLTVEFLLQNIMLVFNWELLQQRLSNAKIPWIIWKLNTSYNVAEKYGKIGNSQQKLQTNEAEEVYGA